MQSIVCEPVLKLRHLFQKARRVHRRKLGSRMKRQAIKYKYQAHLYSKDVLIPLQQLIEADEIRNQSHNSLSSKQTLKLQISVFDV